MPRPRLPQQCPHTRLCKQCEQAAVRAVAYGRTTWQELFERGLAEKPDWNHPGSTRNGSKLGKALKKARGRRKA